MHELHLLLMIIKLLCNTWWESNNKIIRKPVPLVIYVASFTLMNAITLYLDQQTDHSQSFNRLYCKHTTTIIIKTLFDGEILFNSFNSFYIHWYPRDLHISTNRARVPALHLNSHESTGTDKRFFSYCHSTFRTPGINPTSFDDNAVLSTRYSKNKAFKAQCMQNTATRILRVIAFL